MRKRRLSRGQGMVEYALLLVFIAVVVIVVLLTLGQQVANVFSNVAGALGFTPTPTATPCNGICHN